MEQYRYIIASDLDGTLLSEKGDISPENRQAIAEMRELGICFVPCSGRTFGEMPLCVLENPDIRYYIGADGSAIWDKLTGERTELTMDQESVRHVFDLLDSYRTLPTVRINGECYADSEKYNDTAFTEHRVPKAYCDFIKKFVKSAPDFSELIRSCPTVEMICVFFDNDRDMNECKAKIEAMGGFSVASSEPTNLEIFSSRAGKGNGLLALADMLGVPHNRTIAVGDGKNDMDMIKKAGISFAMANACDELKAEADRVICHYRDHSAAYILSLLRT